MLKNQGFRIIFDSLTLVGNRTHKSAFLRNIIDYRRRDSRRVASFLFSGFIPFLCRFAGLRECRIQNRLELQTYGAGGKEAFPVLELRMVIHAVPAKRSGLVLIDHWRRLKLPFDCVQLCLFIKHWPAPPYHPGPYACRS